MTLGRNDSDVGPTLVVNVSKGSHLLKAHDLITSPAFIIIKVADEFHDKTTAPNQLCGRPTSPI